MKLTVLLMLAAVLQVSAKGYSQEKISVNFENVKLSRALKTIEKKSDFRFVYSNLVLNDKSKVTLSANNIEVGKLLRKLFKDAGLAYSIMENNLVAIKSRGEIIEDVHIRGKVTDKSTGDPLVGASVQVKGSNAGVSTDANGNYSLVVPDDAVLIITSVGYTEVEIPVNKRGVIDVALELSTTGLNDVVVIGYGTRAKKDVTTSISVIDSKVISKSIALSAENAMQGTMSGVFVTSSGGNPLDKPIIRIRGVNTWGDADPLFVVDGVVERKGAVGYDINPADIESISVLKDASSAAIYGVQAANGVVLITTKKGKSGPPTIDYSGKYGISNIYQKLDWLTTPQLVEQAQKAYASNTDIAVTPDNVGLFDPTDPAYVGNKPTYNWQDAIRTKNAPIQDHNLSISGGSDKTDYYISFGYSHTVGTILHNFLGRYSGAIKLNTKINNWLKTGINYRLTSLDQYDVWNAKDYFDMGKYPAWQPIFEDEANGIPGYDGYAYVIGGLQPDGTYLTTKLYGEATRVNLLGQANPPEDDVRKALSNNGTIYVLLTPVRGLSIRGQINMGINNAYSQTLTNYNRFPFDYTSGSPLSKGGGKSVGLYSSTVTRGYGQSEEITVSYVKSYKKHYLDLLYNFSHQHFKGFYESAESEYMSSIRPSLRYVNAERQYTNLTTSGNISDLVGHLFRASYNYDSKYYLDATVRRDASYRFAPANRWGTFPGISAAWRITSESFMKNAGITWLDDLKFRVGWGQLGNASIPGEEMPFLSTIYQTPSYAFGDLDSDPNYVGAGTYNIGAATFGIPNPDLTWERNETSNFGFDALLFKNLTFSAEYYSKITKGILQQIGLPLSVGLIIAPSMNIAEVSNKGLEFNANYQKYVNDRFSFNIGANFTTVKNRVLETYKHMIYGNIEEGHSLFYNQAYVVAGVFQTDEEAAEYHSKIDDANVQKAKIGAGDFYFKDLRGAPDPDKPGTFYSEGPDGKIDSYDMVDIGNTIPGFFYGFHFGIDYKGISINSQFTGVGDVSRYNRIKAGTWTSTTGQNTTHIVDNAWTKENPSSTYSRLVFGDPTGNQRNSTFFYESGAYLRLQNLQIGYTLPQSLYQALKNSVKNVYVYVAGSNLVTITKYTGLDPENDIYPMARVFFAGVNIKF